MATIRGALKKQGPKIEGSSDEPQWLRVQKAIYGRFVQQRLQQGGIKVQNAKFSPKKKNERNSNYLFRSKSKTS
jgi:hypothetical protein